MDRVIQDYQSPTYIFDIDVLKNRIQYLRNHLKDIDLCYAMKANPFLAKEVEQLVDRVEVCSPGEYQICQKQAVDPHKIVISGVYKTPSVIEDMIKNQPEILIYTIESLQQYHLLVQLSQDYQRPLQVLLRLTSGNQFGLDEEDIHFILKQKHDYLTIKGIQYFSGTQKTSLKKLKREIETLDRFLTQLKEKDHFEVQEIEYGTGFPVRYFESEDEFDEDEFLDAFVKLFQDMTYQGHKTIELGRSIVASCGQYMTQIVDMKTNKNQNYVIIDGGMHQLVYYGQMMAMKKPFYSIVSKHVREDEEVYQICGALCSINDILMKNVTEKQLHVGDYIIFKNTGAYCMSEGIALFLSRDLPRVVMLKDGQVIVLRESMETYPLNMG